VLDDERSPVYTSLKLSGIVKVFPGWVDTVLRWIKPKEPAMPSILARWKDKVYERLVAWHLRLEQAKPRSVYTALSAAALWPLVQAAQSEGVLPVAVALGSVAAGVGSNLIAEQIQRWNDQAEGTAEADIETWIATQMAADAEFHQTLDTILDHVEAIPQALTILGDADRQWFTRTLHDELHAMGNLPRFEAHLRGSGAIVQGPGAVGAGAGGVAVGGDVHGNITVGAPSSSEPPQGLRDAYLTWVMEQARGVPLTGIDPKAMRQDSRSDLDLSAVYTALMTQRSAAATARETRPERLEERRLSALAVLDAEPRLALLGEPGSGKSTFINFVALCMAGELLGRSDANLSVLRAPVPADEPERWRDEQPPQPQPWHRGALLPIRVVLREFVARGLAPAGQIADPGRDALWRFIVSELPESLRDFERPLRDELLATGGILLLDGLDEVPEANQRRTQVKAAVEAFAAAFPKVVLLVTSRTYAYQNQNWKLQGFAEAVLAPFGSAQIRSFVERWYAHVGQARGLPPDEVQGRSVLLTNAITHTPRLYELAARPLLLTLMASLHAWRGGTLPDQRGELYADAVDLLLDQWESQKVQRRPDGTFEVVQPSLVEWLRVDQKAIRQTLNRLAFEAHRDQPALVGTADMAQSMLVDALMRLQQNPDVRPGRLIEYLSVRAGLLEPRGVGIYAFPHRTFQEYLAACHLTDVGFPDDLADLLRAEPNR
jgi:hypothetical protein